MRRPRPPRGIPGPVKTGDRLAISLVFTLPPLCVCLSVCLYRISYFNLLIYVSLSESRALVLGFLPPPPRLR
jgi:hypothetical protein